MEKRGSLLQNGKKKEEEEERMAFKVEAVNVKARHVV